MTIFLWNRPIPRRKPVSVENLENDEYFVVSAVFEAKDLVGAKLYWEDQVRYW